MARTYDTRTTMFSPEGRLYQVEYATETVSRAGICIGILANDGIILVTEKINTNKLLDETISAEKNYKINENVICGVAGLTSDANVLVNELRLICERYLLQYGVTIPCEQLVSWMCDIKQAYTQHGGKRPFGVSVLYMGWDDRYGFQLYKSEPGGNYSGWKAACIGRDSRVGDSTLERNYKIGEMTIKEALALGIKVLSRTLDTTKLSIDRMGVATLQRIGGKCVARILPNNEVQELIDAYEKAETDEAAKKQEERP